MPRENTHPERLTTSFSALKTSIPKAARLLELFRNSPHVRVPDSAKQDRAHLLDYLLDERLARFGDGNAIRKAKK